ncbi:unnamed protein product [Bemisia tabaci]|uniref:serine--tRNA ligase n=1 Tax=Bemisia tabaci TaxID=7038 RepID=A0A9P0F824_BEMTA|nr:unnamed protein product [Bemisia tabaci]
MNATSRGSSTLKVASYLLKNCLPPSLLLRNVSGNAKFLNGAMKSVEPDLSPPTFDFEHLCGDKVVESVRQNISSRKGDGNIDLVLALYKEHLNDEGNEDVKRKLLEAAACIPNRTHPQVLEYGSDSKVISSTGSKFDYNFKPKSFPDLTAQHNLFRYENMTNLTGFRSYFLSGNLAALEAALIKYTLSYLLENGFKLISVPDIFKKSIIKSCGMVTDGERHQIYCLDENLFGKDWCLSGTSEIAIANYLRNRKFHSSELPINFAAVSRCYRAEISQLAEERGLYRVHQFTKVEMFSVCSPDESAAILDTFRAHQEKLFADLNLHFLTLDMAAHELGAQAYRKYDIEAWMPGRQKYGEISSCSDCTDFQARRFNIKCDGGFAHTVNGTACAIPRLLLTLVETHQTEDGNVRIPAALQKFTGFNRLIDNAEELQKYSLSKIMTHFYKYWDHTQPLNPRKKKRK